jgi:hypothetical protein
MRTLNALLAAGLLMTGLPAVAELEEAPVGMAGAELIELTATVESVNPSSRYVTLRGPEGGMVTVHAGDKVDLSKVSAGDAVLVSYYQSVAVSVAEPGEEPRLAQKQLMGAGPGDMPGTASMRMRSVVEILGVDPYKKAIAFRDAQGHYREVSVKDPALRHYLDELKEGDRVEVVFTEAIAVSMLPR